MDEKDFTKEENTEHKAVDLKKETPDPIEAEMMGAALDQEQSVQGNPQEQSQEPRKIVLDTARGNTEETGAQQQQYTSNQGANSQTQQGESQRIYVEVAGGSSQKNGKAIAAMVLGILSIVFLFCIPFISPVLGIIGIVLSVQARKELETAPSGGRSMATAGLICSIVGLALSLIIVACAICFAGAFFTELSDELQYY